MKNFTKRILGAVIAFFKMSKNKVLNGIAVTYNGVIRGTPILLQLYFFWLWLPKVSPMCSARSSRWRRRTASLS